MKKILFFVLSIVIIAIGTVACDSQKTAQEYLKEEKTSIERFIRDSGLVILNEYPKSGVFQEKEYFKTNEGLYLHVVDSGNGNRAKYLGTILIRYSGLAYFKSDTTKYSFPSRDPFQFILGNPNSYGDYGCSGWEIPLNYVGENAVVCLIIPSALGNSGDNESYRPVYYENLRYRFY